MDAAIEINTLRHRKALDLWIHECRRRMALRFPKVDFDADTWLIRTQHQSQQADWHFPPQTIDFIEKDRSFCEVMRCLVAEMAIAGKPKTLAQPISAFRRLAQTHCQTIFDLTSSDLRSVEEHALIHCRAYPYSSGRLHTHLVRLSFQLNLLADKDVIPRLGYYVRSELSSELRALGKVYAAAREKSSEVLNRKIEALNEALNALIENDSRLDALDKVAICAMTRKLCAPSRINEVLCSSIDDVVTASDYAQGSLTVEDALYQAHKMLLVTMKGSKGAQWSAKPILNFMIDAFNYTEAIIKENGSRSRMLIEWYQENPNALYLPPEFEHLRGDALCRSNLAKIMYFKTTLRNGTESAVGNVFKALKLVSFKGANPETITAAGTVNSRHRIDFLPWADVERFLLQRVQVAMEACRKVCHENHYEGDLAKMLFLFDREDVPYLPYALNSSLIRGRLKKRKVNNNHSTAPTLFQKLGITIPIDGRIQIAEMDTHDPRRWLTTMALRYGENLSDVLINKWANRSSLAQLKAYDFRTDEERAAFSRMPDIAELSDLSSGLALASKLEETYGLKTDIVVVHDAGISVTSLQRVMDAVEDRPIARTSEQIIIVYPSIYGVCLHQHHETPCRRYKRCLTCNENVCVKGHLPTNNEIRKDELLLATSIMRQLETLVAAYNQGIADCPDTFEEHLLTLIREGLSPDQLADHLISEFHEIKDTIKDKLLRTRLEEAFVARGYLRLLDDDTVTSGALMKYRNPKHHAAPGLEMALDTHGGRDKVFEDEKALVEKFPAFAPATLGLRDERYRIEPDDDIEDE
ncbi:hypothetical protein [Pseudoduganella sp. UC29_71]|uniref:hypothetical protein n=1 Tax=Pseudoduganella sp. UC29_71 TaxID=3350174 RepID=UPI003670ACDE